jgi:hypothetical protein
MGTFKKVDEYAQIIPLDKKLVKIFKKIDKM